MAKRYLVWTGTTDGDVNTATNYTNNGAASGGVPIAGDELTFDHRAENNVSAALSTLAAVKLDKIIIAQSFLKEIGDADEYMEVQALAIEIGVDTAKTSPAGSPRIKLDIDQADTDACDISIHNSCSSSSDTDVPPIQLLTTHSGTDSTTVVLNVHKGQVGIAVSDPAESATLLSLNVGYKRLKDSDAHVRLGPQVTIANITKTGGEVIQECAATTVKNYAGSLETRGSGTITTLTVAGGTVTPNSTGTITTLNADGGSTDFTRSTEPRTVTTTYRRAAGRIKYDEAVMTFTNDIDTSGPVEISPA